MATVLFSSGLRRHTDGTGQVEVDAGTVRSLIAELERRFPGLKGQLDKMAVAIDGEIIGEPLLERVSAESEVHFLPPIGGG